MSQSQEKQDIALEHGAMPVSAGNQGGAVTPMRLIEIATEHGASIEQLERLMALEERWNANKAREAFNEAFARFKAEAITIVRSKRVDAGPLAGKYYAELYSVVDAATPALSKHGLSASWRVTKDEKDWIEVTCDLRHVKGHTETVALGGPPDSGGAKNAIQARASTVSYLERYTFLAVTGLATKDQDTDGNGGKPEVEPDPEGKAKLEACGSLNALQEAWKALTPAQRKTLAAVKEECKACIKKADMEAAK